MPRGVKKDKLEGMKSGILGRGIKRRQGRAAQIAKQAAARRKKSAR